MKHIVLTAVAMLAASGVAVAQTTTPAAAKAQKRQEDGLWYARAMKNNVEVAASVSGRGGILAFRQWP